jgi:hypothetical protein
VIAAQPFELVFRILHVMAGVAWAGSAFLFTVFIEPASARLGPGAGPMMEELIQRRKVPEVVTALAAVTVIGGWVLWFDGWSEAGGFGDWIGSAFGLWLSIGGVAATTAFFVGLLGIPPNLKRLAEIGREVEASGGPPTEAQGAAIHRIQERMRAMSRLDLALLALAVFAMATARYW